MKKFAALLIILISVLLFSLIGCSNSDTFQEKSFSTDGNAIEKVSIQVTDRELEIGKSDDSQIHIQYFDSEKEYLDVTVTESKELMITLLFSKEWSDFLGTKPSVEYRKIKVEIPDNFIATLSASTTNNNIKLTALSFVETIDLKTNGGNIVCERVNAGKAISLTAKNGDITGTIIGGYDDFAISCIIKKGNCNLPILKENGEKSFFADCNNGDIDIEFTK